jgi:hypothetical protein
MSKPNHREKTLEEALKLIMDCVDYERGNCRLNEMVGAILPEELLVKARRALVDTTSKK